MAEKLKFHAIIEDAGDGGAFVTVPFDVEQVFGKKRVKVKALIAGEPYRGSLVRMGGDCHILGVRKEIRQKAGVDIGDEIEVMLEEDSEPRTVSVPAELQSALESDPAAAEAFTRLAYTHQKEYAQWIEEAKRAETRQKRAAQAQQMLRDGKKGR